jgi:hypothetical protein
MALWRTLLASLIGLAGILASGPAGAVPITLKGESPDLGQLLVRKPAATAGPKCIAPRQCVPEITLTFQKAPAPISDGILTVVAAGDIGARKNERNAPGFAPIDFVTVFNPNDDPIGSLYRNTVSICPGPPPNDTGGFSDPPKNQTVCGPNGHSVKRTNATDDAPGGSNGKDFFTNQLSPATRDHSITINQAELALLAAGGTITLKLFPNPGATGFAGVGDIKYQSAVLRYEAARPVVWPPSLLLLGPGVTVLARAAWRHRRAVSARRAKEGSTVLDSFVASR